LTIGKRLVKQQYLPHMSSQYGENLVKVGLVVSEISLLQAIIKKEEEE